MSGEKPALGFDPGADAISRNQPAAIPDSSAQPDSVESGRAALGRKPRMRPPSGLRRRPGIEDDSRRLDAVA